MRNSFLILSLLILPFVSFAQQRTSEADWSSERRVAPLPMQMSRAVNDTLLPSAFADTCGNSVLTYLSNANWGFVSGTNGYADKEKAQRFDYSTTADIDILEIWAFFSVAKPVGDGIVQFNLYDLDTGGGPGALIGTTGSSRVSGLGISDTAIIATIFPAIGTISLSGASSYFASLDISGIYATNDTVGLFSTRDGCGDPTSTWEKFSDDSWVSFSSGDSWGLTMDLYLAAVISFDETSSVEDGFSQRGLTLHPAFPVPTTDALNILFEIETASAVSLSVFDLSGKQIRQLELGTLGAGSHEASIAVDDLATGMYTYIIQTETARLGARFQVK